MMAVRLHMRKICSVMGLTKAMKSNDTPQLMFSRRTLFAMFPFVSICCKYMLWTFVISSHIMVSNIGEFIFWKWYLDWNQAIRSCARIVRGPSLLLPGYETSLCFVLKQQHPCLHPPCLPSAASDHHLPRALRTTSHVACPLFVGQSCWPGNHAETPPS